MVRGIGVDIIEIERIKKVVSDAGDMFLKRIFTDGEAAYCQSKSNVFQHFAARFAAKEAVGKALATGWAGEFRWRDVEVTNDVSGKPHIHLHGKVRDLLEGHRVLISLSHSDSHVVAMALIEEERGQ